MTAPGFPRNLGDPIVSAVIPGSGTGSPTPRCPRSRVEDRREQTRDATAVSSCEGNEAYCPRRAVGSRSVPYYRGSGANHPEGPRGEKGTPCHDTVGGKHGGCIGTRVDVSTKQQRIAELSSTKSRDELDVSGPPSSTWTGCSRRTSGPARMGPSGVDGQTGEDYVADLEGNLRSLLERAKSGRYQAPPVRRSPHSQGGLGYRGPVRWGYRRSEDKVLQRAVVMELLEAVYEQDFRDCSAASGLDARLTRRSETLWKNTMSMGGGWILDVDIRKFFDTIDHGHLRGVSQASGAETGSCSD